MISVYSAIKSKIERANQHIEELYGQAKAVIESKDYGYWIERDLKSGEQTIILDGIREFSIPPALSIIAGEVVHQLRSSLDHVVCGLVICNGGTVNRGHQFPIVQVATEYNSVAKKVTKGISPVALVAIEKLQPYHSSVPREHPLSILNELSNTDKHRNLNIVRAVSAPPEYIKVKGNMPGGLSITGYNWVPMKNGAVILRFKPKKHDAEMHPDFRLCAQIAFGNSRVPSDKAVIQELQELTEYVNGIVESFRSDLSQPTNHIDV